MNKESEPQEIWIEYNLELADWVYNWTDSVLSEQYTKAIYLCQGQSFHDGHEWNKIS